MKKKNKKHTTKDVVTSDVHLKGRNLNQSCYLVLLTLYYSCKCPDETGPVQLGLFHKQPCQLVIYSQSFPESSKCSHA